MSAAARPPSMCYAYAGCSQTMQDNPIYEDVVAEIFGYLKCRRDALIEAGLDSEKICLDPESDLGKHMNTICNC